MFQQNDCHGKLTYSDMIGLYLVPANLQNNPVMRLKIQTVFFNQKLTNMFWQETSQNKKHTKLTELKTWKYFQFISE